MSLRIADSVSVSGEDGWPCRRIGPAAHSLLLKVDLKSMFRWLLGPPLVGGLLGLPQHGRAWLPAAQASPRDGLEGSSPCGTARASSLCRRTSELR